jgi:dipeptidyl aminopeptidase/acylaminoacyl peptidase
LYGKPAHRIIREALVQKTAFSRTIPRGFTAFPDPSMLVEIRRPPPRSMRFSPVLLCAAVAVATVLCGCTVPADHPSLEKAALPPLIAAHRFAYHGNVLRSYQLSPDGSKLAWIGPYYMRSRLFVRDNASGEVRRYRIQSYGFTWTPDGKRLLYTSDTSGAENTHIYMLDVERDGAEAVDLTPYAAVKARIDQFVGGKPNELLIYHNRRDPTVSDLYLVDLDTRQETLVARNPGDAISAITSPEGRVLAWQKARPTDASAEGTPRPLVVRKAEVAKNSGETFRALGKTDKGFVWALSSRGRDRVALVLAHPTLGWEKVIFEDPVADVTHVTMSGATGRPLIAHAVPDYPRDEILDPDLRKDLGPLLAAQGREPFGFDVVSTDASEKRIVVSVYTTARQRYYLVDRASRSYTLLGESMPDELSAPLVPMQPVTIASRDGLELHGYLTLPRGTAGRKLPMVLLVHGGPWLRSTWGNPLQSDDASYSQFLANRGYAVLLVNFRGSTGYGRAFTTAGIGEFAGRMQDDLEDAAQWAIDGGIADPGRIAIMGWSYGGYAALVGLTMTPERFACGVSLAGPSDLASLIESFPPYWKNELAGWHDYVGNPAIPQDREQMNRISPLYYADRIQRPVLIVQGMNDVRVRPDQSERMVAALRQAGKAVEYVAVPEMGHGMAYWAHRLKILRHTEAFLHDCIGGRAERFDAFDAVAWAWTRVTRVEETSAAP